MKRYVLEAEKYLVEDHFEGSSKSEVLFEPNYNVIPGNTMPIVVQVGNERSIVKSVWGLELPKRKERLSEMPQEEILKDEELAKLVKGSPCIIPASGFYKWKETVKDPLPFYLRVLTEDVTGFAGVYHSYEDKDGRLIHSFLILTMPANALVEPLDDRMPVILAPEDYEAWLKGEGTERISEGFSGNHLLPHMGVVRVPELVNDPSNNSKELIQPIPKLRNYDGEEE